MNRFALLFCCFLMIVTAPATGRAQTFGKSDAIENAASGTINWTSGEVYAKGIGAPPSLSANSAQARAMAERAAFVVAIRNLLETVKGVRVDSETVVENFMVKSDVIKTRVDGIVKGAQILKKQYMSDGSVEVLVGMSMRGALLNAVVPENFGRQTPPMPSPQKPDIRPQKPIPQPAKPPEPAVSEKRPKSRPEPAKPGPVRPEPAKPEPVKAEPLKAEPPKPEPKTDSIKQVKPEVKPEPVKPAPSAATIAFKGGVATGLVIDGRGLGLKPALLPKIVDQQGQEVYVGQVVTRTNAVEQGVAGYAKDVDAAANNFRVTDNPAVIKGLNAAGAARTDIMIAQADADSLRKISSNGEFLQFCRVIIVY